MAHAVVHFEIDAADEGSLVAFYEAVFDWTLQGSGGGRTAIDTHAGGINGGIGKSLTGDAWSSFCVETDDPQATLDKAEKLGGKTILPVTELPEVTIALFADPEGHVVGLAKGM